MADLTPPPDLSPAALAIWQQVLTELDEAGQTARATPDLLRAHVEAVTTHRRASALLGQTDILIQQGQGPDARPVPSPALAIQKTAADTITKTTRALGLNRPPARAVDIRAGQPMRTRSPEARWCDEHKRWECTGSRSRGRGLCHGIAMEGLTTCRMHQGRHGKVAHLAAVAARKRTGGVPRDVHPAQALLEEVAYWTGLCDWLDEIVGELEQGNAVWGISQRTDVTGGEFPGATVIERADLNVWVKWQHQAHREKVTAAKAAVEAEVDTALLRLEQAKGMQVFRAFQLGLEQLELTEAQWAIAREAMPRVLRELTAA